VSSSWCILKQREGERREGRGVKGPEEDETREINGDM